MNDSPVKVLSVCTSDSTGGAARAAYRIHRAVRDLGVDSRMFVKQKGTDDPTVLTVDDFIPHHALYRGIDWIRNKVKNKWQHHLWGKYPDREKNFMSDLRSTDIGGALRKIDYDILHLHWVNLRFLPLEQLPKDKPIVWTLHDNWAFSGICHSSLDCSRFKDQCGRCPLLHSDGDNDLSHRIWLKKKRLYSHLDLHVVTPSRWLGECVKESGLMGDFPTCVISNSLDTSVFRPVCNQALTPKAIDLSKQVGDRHLIVFGAMRALEDPVKGFPILREALQYISREGKGNRYALAVFGSTDTITGIPEEIATFNLGIIREEDELVSLYNIASVVAVPSRSEVFGQVASEAMACGTPVVAFRCTGIQEVVREECGYLARPFDAGDFAHGICHCVEGRDANLLSENARRIVLEEYTQDHIGAQYARLYTSLMK